MTLQRFSGCTLLFSVLLLLLFTACSKERNPFKKQTSTCTASQCHTATQVKQYPPSTGQHAIHLVRGYICENCHYNYLEKSIHKDGILDVNGDVDIVFFDSLNPSGVWNNTTSDCSYIACHGGGSTPINWYAQVTGDCTVCHSEGSPIDPLSTNGQGVKGKHTVHVTDQNIECNTCHYDYKSRSTHMNNVYGGSSETESIVRFNGTFDSTAVTTDFNDSTGQCDNISCHGGTGDVNWYSDSSGCTSCHSSGSAIDPMTTNGSGGSGKHGAHVTDKAIECVICHEGYKDKDTHMNGTYGKAESSTIVYFDTDGSQGSSWGNVSAVFTDADGTCDSISCHGGYGGVNWYSTATGCSACHISGSIIDPLTTSGSGTDGKHTVHVTGRAIDCQICHEDYKTIDTHMNGTYGKAESSTIVYFDTDGSQGSSWGNVSAVFTDADGTCDSISCHGGSGGISWYDNVTGCSFCHKASIGSRRQIFDSNGDGSGVGGDFNKESHHVIDYANRNTQIVQDSDCIVCHEQSSHMSGTIRLKDKDNAGQVIVYDPANVSSLELFCLSCHDSDGAGGDMSPFGNGTGGTPNTLGVIPNSAGSTIKDSWIKTYGHRDKGLTCMGTGLPGTGCHGDSGQINAHGSGNYGLLTGNMNFRIQAQDNYNETDYELCFSCHSSYAGVTKEDILGVKSGGNYDYILELNPPLSGGVITFGSPPYYNSGLVTKFVDSDGNQHGDGGGGNKYQLHWYHISMRVRNNNSSVADAWLYRGEGILSGCGGCHSSNAITTGNKATCISCHNVHGSNTPFGFLYDEFNMTHDIGETTGTMGMSTNDLVNGPFYCGVQTCHSSEGA